MTIKPNISMFFPAYNEEGNIGKVLQDAQDVLKKHAKNYEIIIVLYEGSTDRTEEIIHSCMKKDQNIRIVLQAKDDHGIGKAYRIGLNSAKYENIFYSDSDNQFDLHEFEKFLPYIGEYDVIAGYKLKREDPFLRKVISFGYNLFVRFAFRMNIWDVNTAFRLVKKHVIDEIQLYSKYGTVTTEMLIKAKKRGFKIKSVGVRHFNRGAGKPLYEIKAGLLSPMTILKVTQELLWVWREVNSPEWKTKT